MNRGIRSRLHRNRPEMDGNDPDKYSTARLDDLGFNWSTIEDSGTKAGQTCSHVQDGSHFAPLPRCDGPSLPGKIFQDSQSLWLQRQFCMEKPSQTWNLETNWGSKISDNR